MLRETFYEYYGFEQKNSWKDFHKRINTLGNDLVTKIIIFAPVFRQFLKKYAHKLHNDLENIKQKKNVHLILPNHNKILKLYDVAQLQQLSATLDKLKLKNQRNQLSPEQLVQLEQLERLNQERSSDKQEEKNKSFIMEQRTNLLQRKLLDLVEPSIDWRNYDINDATATFFYKLFGLENEKVKNEEQKLNKKENFITEHAKFAKNTFHKALITIHNISRREKTEIGYVAIAFNCLKRLVNPNFKEPKSQPSQENQSKSKYLYNNGQEKREKLKKIKEKLVFPIFCWEKILTLKY